MDPCPFVRVLVGNLALRFPIASRPARSGVHPSTSPCYCRIRLTGQPYQTAAVQLLPPDGAAAVYDPSPAATFHLSLPDLHRLSSPPSLALPLIRSARGLRSPKLKIAIYTGRRGSTCGVSSGRLLGRISIPLDLKLAEDRKVVYHSGWLPLSSSKSDAAAASAKLHLTVRAEPDPRFVFEFGGEPECSPQVFQVHGATHQPVFTCKFSCRNNPAAADRSLRSRLV